MKYRITSTRKFNKDVKRCLKRGYPMQELREVLLLLEESGKLPLKYHQHKLTGNYEGRWECHIKADWLLVWEEHEDELVLLLTDTGSHADIFG